MNTSTQNPCQCEKKSCGCANVNSQRCQCGESCPCQPTCTCDPGCGCAKAK